MSRRCSSRRKNKPINHKNNKTKALLHEAPQTGDKVFGLRQRKRNDGRFGDRTASGVYFRRGPRKIADFSGFAGYVERCDRRKAMTAGVTGFSVSSASLIFGKELSFYDVMLASSFLLSLLLCQVCLHSAACILPDARLIIFKLLSVETACHIDQIPAAVDVCGYQIERIRRGAI